jgi:hypothetical protein
MRYRKLRILAVIALSFMAGRAASAADMRVEGPVYKPSQAGAASDNLYFWLDGTYDRVRLPTYKLGLHAVADGGILLDTGNTVQTFDPSLNGGGIRGAIGYFMSGTSTRYEFGGSYVEAKGSSSQITSITTYDVLAQFVNGAGTNGFGCLAPASCNTAGTLSTDYNAWQFNGKIASDWKFGLVTVTPSVAVFGGNTRVGQMLSQSFTQFLTGVVSATGTYTASSREKWWDIGARIGVDVNAPVTTALTVGIGGWVGGANRRTFLSGNDAANDTVASFNGNGTLSISDSKIVFLANAETGFAYKLTQTVILRGFAGLNYDGSVPGITNPTYSGGFFAPTSTTAASIYYAHAMNYYTGGGLQVMW